MEADMSKITKIFLISIAFACMGFYAGIHMTQKRTNTQEEKARVLLATEFASIIKDWKIKEDSTLFVPKYNIANTNKFFEMIKEDYGSCSMPFSPVCVSNDQKTNEADLKATKFGPSITCTYLAKCERITTRGTVTFKQINEQKLQIDAFSID
jgi:hypothetical protein